MLEAATLAATRWVEALNSPRDPVLVRTALAPWAVLYRYGAMERAGTLVETFRGWEAVDRWMARSPRAPITFWLARAVEHAAGAPAWWGPTFFVRYAYAAEGWVHGGGWRFGLAPDGRLAWLEHFPDRLPTNAGADIDWTATVEAAQARILGASAEDAGEGAVVVGAVEVGGVLVQGDHHHEHHQGHTHE